MSNGSRLLLALEDAFASSTASSAGGIVSGFRSSTLSLNPAIAPIFFLPLSLLLAKSSFFCFPLLRLSGLSPSPLRPLVITVLDPLSCASILESPNPSDTSVLLDFSQPPSRTCLSERGREEEGSKSFGDQRASASLHHTHLYNTVPGLLSCLATVTERSSLLQRPPTLSVRLVFFLTAQFASMALLNYRIMPCDWFEGANFYAQWLTLL